MAYLVFSATRRKFGSVAHLATKTNPKNNCMIITELRRNFHQITWDFKNGDEFWVLLSSDHHWDNPDCKRDMMKRHFDEAVKLNAPIIMVGDFFCAMQGKYDKRSDKSKLRPEHQTGKYLDSLVETAADWLKPYREHIAVIGHGNHETAIQNRHETNLIERLVERLNYGNPGRVHMGGYGGWLRLTCAHGGRKTHSSSVHGKYFHGSGGGGPVTKGTIQSQRQAVMFPDADFVVSGHVHEQYTICHMQERIDLLGNVRLREQWHVRLPTYKDEYKDGYGGWHVETGKGPKPLGAYWMRIRPVRDTKCVNVGYDFIMAK
jgi:UDP-2,3-diacylglucosamine pyrophosphatase LpxH